MSEIHMATITTIMSLVSGHPHYPHPGTNIDIERRDVCHDKVERELDMSDGSISERGLKRGYSDASRISFSTSFGPVSNILPR